MKKRFICFLFSIVSTFFILNVSLMEKNAYASSLYYVEQLDDYPSFNQGNTHYCWGYSIASIVSYVKGSRCNVEVVFMNFYNATGRNYNFNDPNEQVTIIDAKNYLSYMIDNYTSSSYLTPHYYLSALTQNSIKGQIDSNCPVYITGYRYKNGEIIGHAVALMGYKKSKADNNIYGIYCMNPQSGDIEYSPYIEGSLYRINSSNNEIWYTWNQTVVLI